MMPTPIVILNTALTLDNYDLLAHYYDVLDGDKLVEVTIDMQDIYPEIWGAD